MRNEAIIELSHILRYDVNTLSDILSKEYKIISVYETPPITNEIQMDRYIRTFKIQKRKRGQIFERTLYFPYSNKLRSSLKILASWISKLYTPPQSVHGYVKGRGIKTNAKNHLGCKFLLKLDFENFYNQIDVKAIANSLEVLGIYENLAILISKLTTIDNMLVQGFSTSPVISNIITENLDMELEDYSKKNGIVYSRYADDMSFSSKVKRPNVTEIFEIISKYNFTINQSKTRETIRGNYQCVTGLTVFDEKFPRIPKRIKKNLRLELHNISKHGIKKHAIHRLIKMGNLKEENNLELVNEEIKNIQARISGWINYSFGIEENFSVKMANIFDNAR